MLAVKVPGMSLQRFVDFQSGSLGNVIHRVAGLESMGPLDIVGCWFSLFIQGKNNTGMSYYFLNTFFSRIYCKWRIMRLNTISKEGEGKGME